MKKKTKPCAVCEMLTKERNDLKRSLEAIHSRLGCVDQKGHLVMWPDADMECYSIMVQIAGLLQDEIAVSKIRTKLLKVGVRRSNVIDGVQELVDKYYQSLHKEKV